MSNQLTMNPWVLADLPLYASSCMGSFSCLDTLPEDAIADLHECCLSCEKSHATVEVCTCLNNNQSTGTTNMRIPNVPSICNENMIAIHGVDGSHAFILSINKLQGQLSIGDVSSDEKILGPKKAETPEELCLPADWNVKKQKALAKSATFPSTLVTDIDDSCSSISTEFSDQCSSTKSNLTYARSISFPVSPKLISAMKGSRALHSSPSNLNLHVKWAPDVYDPPCTLLSHTVKKNHHQLPKARKNYNNKHKHKHKHKAKSARASNNDRGTANRIIYNKTESLNARLQSTRRAGLLHEYGKSSIEGVGYTISNQDSKCGGCFMVEALAKVNISSVTEVT